MQKTYTVQNVVEMQKIIKSITKFLRHKKINILLLIGELGSGKTTFVKYLAKLLNVKKPITSPTFLIIKEYQITNYKLLITNLIHYDLYRLRSYNELEEIGFWEKIADPKNLIMIEWPDKIHGLINKLEKKYHNQILKINFSHTGDIHKRKIIIKNLKGGVLMVDKAENPQELEGGQTEKDEQKEKKGGESKLKNGLKIAAGVGILAGVTWAVQKGYRRYHRKKFIKKFLESISDETKNTQERIKDLTSYSSWSKEAEWIFQEFKNIRKAINKLSPREEFHKAFNKWLGDYGYARKVPVDRLAKILHWNLDKMTDFEQ